MNKNITLIAAAMLSIGTQLHAQDIRSYIPKDVQLIGEIRGQEVHKYIKDPNLKTHFLSKPFIEEFVNNFTDDADEFMLEQIGINSNAPSYYFYQYTDSITYYVQMYPLSDNALFSQKINELEPKQLTGQGTFNSVKYGEHVYMWNSQVLFIIEGDLNAYYYYSQENNPYGLKNVNFYDYYKSDYSYSDYTTEEVAEAVADATEAIESAEDDADYTMEAEEAVEAPAEYEVVYDVETAASEHDDVVVEEIVEESAYDIASDDLAEPAPVAVSIESNVEDTEQYDSAVTSYDAAYEEQQIIRDSLELAFTMHYINDINRQPASILDDKNYLKTHRDDVYANVYIKNLNSLIPNNKYSYGMMSSLYAYNNLAPYQYYYMNMEVQEGKVNINYEVGMTKDQARKYKKVEQRKINKKILKYINTKEDIAGLGFSYNTENYLHYSYDIIKQISDNENFWGASQKIIVDIVDLLLDEKAIGKAYKGDGVFLIRGIKPHKYTYTSYEYTEDEDGDYSYEKVKKEKEENLPEFLLMYSTDNPKIHRKILEYALKAKAIQKKNGIYAFEKDMDIPYQIYCLIRDGIVFLGTDYKEMEQISLGRYKGNINCKTKRKYRKNSLYGFIQPSYMKNKIKTGELTESIRLNNFIDNLGMFEWKHPKQGCKKRNKGTLTGYTPRTAENGMDYILFSIDNFLDFIK